MATIAPRGGLLGRVKPLDAILATAEKKGLHRSLGAFQLTLLGIGAVIGTGIFVLTAEAAQKAGPAMMISFVIAGFVCAVAALCYSELASMVPVAGSAYTYTYAVMGELFAWMVGWALILEYAIGASAVAVGWSGYFVGLMKSWGVIIPPSLAAGPFGGGVFNLPAAIIAGLVTILLIVGTKESARFNAVLVLVKVTALTIFCILTLPILKGEHFSPFIPNGWGTYGVVGAAASIFFAYVGFDAVSTAAEETKNPQRNVPIGLIGSLGICTIFYLLVAAGAIGAIGAQPVRDALGHPYPPGSIELTNQCSAILAQGVTQPLVCSREALAHVLRTVGYQRIGDLMGIAAFIALPSVVLMMMFGQTRIFFVMARDGLLPRRLSVVSSRKGAPVLITAITGVFVAAFAGFLRLDEIAELANAGTLAAFIAVAACMMILRKRSPELPRIFRCPWPTVVGSLAIVGCIYLLFSLPSKTISRFFIWNLLGIAVYVLYGRARSVLVSGTVPDRAA